MSLDEQFARILRDAAELAPDPPGAVLAQNAERRGRRQQLRRRTVLASSVSVVALASLAALTIRPSLEPTHHDLTPSGGQPTAISAQFMVDTFRSVLPPGQIGDTIGWGLGEGGAPGQGPGAHLTFDSGQGSGMVNLSTDKVDLPITDATQGTQCFDPVEMPNEGCDRTVNPDGSVVVVDKLAPREPMKVREWVVIYTGIDGRQVRIDEYNSHSAGPPLTGEHPPLTPVQLVAAATSLAWDPLFAQFTRGATGKPVAKGTAVAPTPERILSTVTGLLPPGATTDIGVAQHIPGQAHTAVTLDGRTSMVSVFVRPNWSGDGKSNPRAIFEGGIDPSSLSRTADGSSVVVRETGASKSGGGPTLSWSVDVLQPDNTRVTVTEFNGPDEAHVVPGTPALTVEQLKAIGTGAAWRQ